MGWAIQFLSGERMSYYLPDAGELVVVVVVQDDQLTHEQKRFSWTTSGNDCFHKLYDNDDK